MKRYYSRSFALAVGGYYAMSPFIPKEYIIQDRIIVALSIIFGLYLIGLAIFYKEK